MYGLAPEYVNMYTHIYIYMIRISSHTYILCRFFNVLNLVITRVICSTCETRYNAFKWLVLVITSSFNELVITSFFQRAPIQPKRRPPNPSPAGHLTASAALFIATFLTATDSSCVQPYLHLLFVNVPFPGLGVSRPRFRDSARPSWNWLFPIHCLLWTCYF